MAKQTSQPRALNAAAAAERRGGPAGFAERRQQGRLHATLQTQIKSAAQADFEDAYTTDVSDSGAFIRASVPLVRGTLIRFQHDDGIDGVGRVVWVREVEDSSHDEPPGMGIKFLKLSDRSKELIEQLATQPPEGEAEPPPRPEAVAQPEPQPEAVAQPEPQPEAVAQPEPQPEAVAQPEPQPEAVRACEVRHVMGVPSEPAPSECASTPAPVPDRAADAPQAQAVASTPAPDAATHAPRAHAVASTPGPDAATARQDPPVLSQAPSKQRHLFFAAAALGVLAGLTWALTREAPPEPAVESTEVSLPAVARPAAPPPATTAPASAPSATTTAPSATASAAQGAEELPQVAPKALRHVLHVDTDPEGGWLVVNKQRMPTPADIELEAYDGKRFPLTAGRRHHEQRVVYVQAEQFVERDGVLRADVRVALKRKSVAVASQIESEQRDAEKTPEEAPQALEEKPVEVPDPATLVAEPEPIADDPATAEP